MDGSRRASASMTLSDPSVEPSSTTRISFAIGTAMTRFNNSATVGRSLKQGTITERTGASRDVAKPPESIRQRQKVEVALVFCRLHSARTLVECRLMNGSAGSRKVEQNALSPSGDSASGPGAG